MKRLVPRMGLALMLAGFGSWTPAVAWQGGEPKPRLWTVLVSVEGYKAPIPARPGLAADGRKLASWLQRTAGWGPEQVLELNDNGDPRPGNPGALLTSPLRPTRDNLKWAFEQWLTHPGRVAKDDVVLIAFAGRGAVGPEGAGLLPIDARPGEPGWSPERSIERLIRDFKCSAVLCWVDAPMFDPSRPGEAVPSLVGDRLLDRLARWPGSSAWMATGERPASRGSAFAGALRGALGNAPRSLMATLATLDRDPEARGLGFRQLGGVPADLSLFRDRFQAPRKARAGLLVQKGHADRVNALTILADGRSMISTSQDSTIRAWDPSARDRALLRVFPEFVNSVTAMALGADGRHLAGGDGMGEILAWDLAGSDPRPIALGGPRPHGSLIRSLAFLPEEPPSADGKAIPGRFVSVGQDNLCEVWDIAGRTLAHRRAQLPPTKGLMVAAASTPGGPSAFVAIGEDGLLRAFDRAARPSRPAIPVLGGRPTALRLDPEGRWAAVGDDAGHVRVVDLATGSIVLDRDPLPGPVSTIRIGPGKLLAVSAGDGLYLVPIEQAGRILRLSEVREACESVEFSVDGAWLAACSRTGDLFAWKLGAGKAPEAVKLDRSGAGLAASSCVAFGPSSGPPILAAGENDGGIRRWDLKALEELPRLAPHRGKVRQVGATPDGRHLLQVTEDGDAQVWDLREGRSVRTLAGSWSAGAFLPDGRLAMARHPVDGGGLVVVEAREGRPDPLVKLDRPEGPGGDYARVVVSKDGRRVAASAARGRDEEVHVWDLPVGKLRVLSPHAATVTSLEFSADGATLMTAGEDGLVRLWDLADPGRKAPIAEYADTRTNPVDAITAAALDPSKAGRVVAGALTGEDRSVVLYWPGAGSKVVQLAEVPGRVLSVAFLAGGRYVAASGRDRRILAWELAEGRAPERIEVRVGSGPAGMDAAPHHTEKVNDLMAWPLLDGPALISGSDDATIRLWRVDPALPSRKAALQLLGTLASAPDEAPAAGRRAGADAPWVAFTPEGVYDASLDGERLVTFGDGRTVDPLDQYAPRLFHPLLTDQFRRGLLTTPRAFHPPPPLVIDAPDDLPTSRAEAEIKVAFGDPTLKPEALRLYQNDVPIRDGSDFRPTALPGQFAARVKLVPGNNRLYAMAGRPDDVDARSRDLTLFHSGPANPGRMHVLALGVGEYARNRLQFPVKDAEQLADFLQRKGVGAGRSIGRKILLRDGQVDPKSVREAFARVRDEVRGHPEDTVVVFLAGHTDVLTTPDGQSRYSLLLPSFPFPKTDPAQAVLRGEGVAATIRAPEGAFLAYSAIYRDLTALDALQRLVIVDACQAEAVVDDPGVRLVEQLKAMDREARPTRTSYFLASRRGESAEEAPALEHGLLTYVLLRGMGLGAPELKELPPGVSAFVDEPIADLDNDGIVTTRELRRFVDMNLPRLAESLPGRPRTARPQAIPPAPRTPRPFDDPRLSASGPSFPLVNLPSRPAVAASAKP